MRMLNNPDWVAPQNQKFILYLPDPYDPMKALKIMQKYSSASMQLVIEPTENPDKYYTYEIVNS